MICDSPQTLCRLEGSKLKNLGLLDLLELTGFKQSPTDKIVRHQHDRYPVKELLGRGLLETYQAYQSKPVFHKAKHVVAVYGLEGNRACFFGVFRKVDYRSSKDGPLQTGDPWECEWQN